MYEPNDNLKELHIAEGGRTWQERAEKHNVLIGALSQLVDAKTWAAALNTTYGYIKSVDSKS